MNGISHVKFPDFSCPTFQSDVDEMSTPDVCVKLQKKKIERDIIKKKKISSMISDVDLRDFLD